MTVATKLHTMVREWKELVDEALMLVSSQSASIGKPSLCTHFSNSYLLLRKFSRLSVSSELLHYFIAVDVCCTETD